MSKAEKPTRPIQLRKELGQAAKAIEDLTSSLRGIETTLANSDAALSNEKALKGKISELEKEVAKLREEHEAVRSQHHQDRASFTNTILKMTDEFAARSNETEVKHEEGMKDLKHQMDEQEKLWQKKIDAEKLETIRAKTSQSKGRRELEGQLQKANEECGRMKEKLNTALQENKSQVVELEQKIKNLTFDLNNHKTILTGRETEIKMHRSRLDSLESFPAEDSTGK
jgi:chromosome segregation ATPase